MKKYSFLTGLLLIAGLVISQSNTEKKIITSLKLPNGTEVMLSSLGYMRIKSKDGTAKVKCIIKEITPCCTIFIKDRVLHDIMNDKVRSIICDDSDLQIHFDEKFQPYLIAVKND